jgi:hypothetical protein
VIFLVQGAFAVHRGFEKLINVWDKVDSRAKLWLRGPGNPEKTALIELAKSKGVLDRGVFFPDAVDEAELVAAAREADVGLVPYEPIGPNYRYCSPNKLSQYLAAGLPIICNELDFVKSVVVGNGVGAAVDFRDEAALARTIDEFVGKRDSIPALSRRAQALFKSSFNWLVQSRNVYAAIKTLVSAQQSNKSEFDFGWITDPNRRGSSVDLSAQEALSDEMQRLSDVTFAEIHRLNEVYTEEIGRLNKSYTDEIDRLNKSYSFEIMRLKNNPLRMATQSGMRRARALKAMAKALVRARNE